VVDLEYTKKKGIPVTNVPAYSTASVAQMTFALILEIVNRVGYHSETVHKGQWNSSADFCYWHYPLIELEGKTLGLIGLGNIGKQVARIAHALDMKVLAYRRNHEPVDHITYCDFNDLLIQSDIISLHCPLTKETTNCINAAAINKMKNGAILINTGRGPLVNEQALANALKSGKLAGAGLDVLHDEPPKNGSPLLGIENCYITPHIAWATQAARQRLLDTVVKNIIAFLEGKPVHVVNDL
jgi:glycerate dehydrogenase